MRFQQTLYGTILIDVVCDCGANGLKEKTSEESSFKHAIRLDSREDKRLQCDRCGREYILHPQGNHLHVTDSTNVLFYEDRFYGFSNFSSFAVEWRGIVWMTSEHAYQAAKFSDPYTIEKIRQARSAHDAKKIAHEHKAHAISNWREIKLSIMEEIIRAKLSQHPYLKRKLLETGTRTIVENSPTDSFWGRGADWKGENHLGKLWMRLRDELRFVEPIIE